MRPRCPCEHPDRRNADASLPSIPPCKRAASVGALCYELSYTGSGAHRALWHNYGCSRYPGPTPKRASRTKEMPSSVPTAHHQASISFIQCGSAVGPVGNSQVHPFNLPAETYLHRAGQCQHGLPICGQFIELTWVAIAESQRFATKTSLV